MKKIKVPPNWQDEPGSFERFKKLAKALMTVPKKDLDKELAKHERSKNHQKLTKKGTS